VGNEVNQNKLERDATFQANATLSIARALKARGNNGSTNGTGVFGPDTHSFTLRASDSDFAYIEQYINNTCGDLLGYTYHSYVNREDLLTPEGLDEQLKESSRFDKAVRNGCPGARIAAGEIGPHNNGGIPGYPGAFLGSFWYLDALGSLAVLNHQPFFRQSLVSSGYGLLLEKSLDPTPDYWLALLHSRLVGGEVYRANSSTEYFRVYSHNSLTSSSDDAGGRAYVYLNLHNETVEVKFPSSSSSSHSQNLDLYALTADDLKDQSVMLNGAKLELDDEGKIPDMQPVRVSPRDYVKLPGPSLGFVIIE
jgi:hypothetical protein